VYTQIFVIIPNIVVDNISNAKVVYTQIFVIIPNIVVDNISNAKVVYTQIFVIIPNLTDKNEITSEVVYTQIFVIIPNSRLVYHDFKLNPLYITHMQHGILHIKQHTPAKVLAKIVSGASNSIIPISIVAIEHNPTTK